MNRINTVKYLSTFVLLTTLAIIDIISLNIPNSVLLIFLAAIIAIKTYEVYFERTIIPVIKGIGGLGVGLLFLVIAIISDGAVGGGDIKLITLIGILFGFRFTLMLSMISALFIAIFYLIFIVILKSNITFYPFVPFLLLAFIAVIVMQNRQNSKVINNNEVNN